MSKPKPENANPKIEANSMPITVSWLRLSATSWLLSATKIQSTEKK
ncbi:MAG: hypothetical protein IJ867_05045 [Clostridia bacterium]|nr:hypothetical protein [Clostridia bacterium]